MKKTFEITEEVIKQSNESFVRVPMDAIGRIAINPRSTGLVETNLINIVKDLLKGNVEKEEITEDKIREYIDLGKVPSELVDAESEIEVPIILGEVQGIDGLVVVDGYHREKATQITGKKEIKAKIQRFASIEDAREEAFRLNEAKGVSLNEADIAFSLYTNYIARLKKDTSVNLDAYVKKHCSKDPLKSKRLVYYAFIKTEILGEDFDLVENGHTIYEYFIAILRHKGYGYLNTPFEFKQQIRDLIDELHHRQLFNRKVVIWIRDKQKDLLALNEEFDLVDLVSQYVEDRGSIEITEEEQRLADETERNLRENKEANESIINGADSSETSACADIPTKTTSPPVENDEDEKEFEAPKVKPVKEFSPEDSEESACIAASYIVSILTVGRANPNTVSPTVKETLVDMVENIKLILDLNC